jgi:hypothetical protein
LKEKIMAPPSLVHFGVDTCFRLPVLRSAGFRIVECESINEFSLALTSHPHAVVLEEEPDSAAGQAIAVARSQSDAPVILFAAEPCLHSYRVDLIIPAFTTPERWLEQIWALVERTHPAQQELPLMRAAGAERFLPEAERKPIGRVLIEMRKRSGE